MNARSICAALTVIALCLPAFAEPKAYDLVKFRGKAGGLTIAFDFGAGYPEASEIRISKAGARKSTRFVLDDAEQMRFVPEKDRGGGDEVILKMSPYDVPEKVDGVYRTGGKTISFSLTQR